MGVAQQLRIAEYADQAVRGEILGNDNGSPLRHLLETALAKQDALRALQGLGDTITDAQYCRADEAAFYARKALLDHLLFDHGIGSALAQRFGDVL